MFNVFAIIIAIIIGTLFSGCNKQVIDLNYNFKYAIIETGIGIIEGEVQSWKDYDESDQIQVKIDDTTYLVHSSRITLMTNKPQ